jgi:zinc transporter ZupT
VAGTTALALLLATAGLLVGGAAAAVRPGRATGVQAAAGGLLVALVGVDLLPDAFADGTEAGVRPPALIAVAVVALLVTAWWALGDPATADGCCTPQLGRFAAYALAAHGVAEGLLLGLGSGLVAAAGPWLLVAFCLHKAGEGFAIIASVEAGSRRWTRAAGWLALAALAPPVGALLGERFPVTGAALPLATSAVAGVLAGVALRLLRPALRARRAEHRVTALIALVSMSIVIGLGSA